MIVTWGRLLDGTSAEIPLTAVEAGEFAHAESYTARLHILRGAGLRAKLVSMLLTGGGILVPNLGGRQPEAGETLVWLRAGQFSEALDRSPKITLGPEAVRLLTIRSSHPGPRTPPTDPDLLSWLDPASGATVREVAEVLGIGPAEAARRLAAQAAKGMARREPPRSGHRTFLWYLVTGDDPELAVDGPEN